MDFTVVLSDDRGVVGITTYADGGIYEAYGSGYEWVSRGNAIVVVSLMGTKHSQLPRRLTLHEAGEFVQQQLEADWQQLHPGFQSLLDYAAEGKLASQVADNPKCPIATAVGRIFRGEDEADTE